MPLQHATLCVALVLTLVLLAVCVRFQDRGHQRTYVLFFKGSEFLDERYAVLTDACDAQTYSEFDLGPSGAMRPGAVGDPGPLY
jgi:hypothetical protein